jgi:hypothetical protein
MKQACLVLSGKEIPIERRKLLLLCEKESSTKSGFKSK